MNCVSIIYRNSRHPPAQSLKKDPQARNSVDQYESRLTIKEFSKDKIALSKHQTVKTSLQKRVQQRVQSRVQLKTAGGSRIGQNTNLNIMAVSVQPLEDKEILKEGKKTERVFNVKRIKTSRFALKGLDSPSPMSPFVCIRYDDQHLDRSMHGKLRQIYRSKNDKDARTVLVMSADLIVNQFSFWEDQPVEDHCIRTWKTLQTHAQIVWVCNREITGRKILKFVEQNELRVDGIYQVVPKKLRRTLTVSFQSIEDQFSMNETLPNMVIVQGVVSETGEGQSVPILRNKWTLIHWIKMEMCNRNRFESVLRILSRGRESFPEALTNVNSLIEKYEKMNSNVKLENVKVRREIRSNVEEETLRRLQELRMEFIRHFSQTYRLHATDKIKYDESENSVRFIVGDMLRRNQKTIIQYGTYLQKYRDKYQEKEVIDPATIKRSRSTTPMLPKTVLRVASYRHPIYLWCHP